MTIDVHSHTLPQLYRDALNSGVVRNPDGFPMPEWSLEDHLKMMESHRIQACVVSISSPGLRFADPETAMNLARAINIGHAQMVADHPARFGAFALLPMPDVEASLREIKHALEVLKLDGVGLYTNYDGIYLGDSRFAPVLEDLHRRKAVVFVHPASPPHVDALALGYPAPMLEYPFDTTRMVVSLLDTNTLDRCSHIRFIVCHGGGALPLLLPRIGPIMQSKREGNQLSSLVNSMRMQREVRALFFDLAASTHPAYLAALREAHDPSKLLMGFDFPFMPQASIGGARKGLEDFEGFSEQDKELIDGANAEELFPRLAESIRRSLNGQISA